MTFRGQDLPGRDLIRMIGSRPRAAASKVRQRQGSRNRTGSRRYNVRDGLVPVNGRIRVLVPLALCFAAASIIVLNAGAQTPADLPEAPGYLRQQVNALRQLCLRSAQDRTLADTQRRDEQLQ